jgi:hypothetical protein
MLKFGTLDRVPTKINTKDHALTACAQKKNRLNLCEGEDETKANLSLVAMQNYGSVIG